VEPEHDQRSRANETRDGLIRGEPAIEAVLTRCPTAGLMSTDIQRAPIIIRRDGRKSPALARNRAQDRGRFDSDRIATAAAVNEHRGIRSTGRLVRADFETQSIVPLLLRTFTLPDVGTFFVHLAV
jgi:hypothetical protein